jgi:hypothetical protein
MGLYLRKKDGSEIIPIAGLGGGSGGGDVESVNGKTGAVILNDADLQHDVYSTVHDAIQGNAGFVQTLANKKVVNEDGSTGTLLDHDANKPIASQEYVDTHTNGGNKLNTTKLATINGNTLKTILDTQNDGTVYSAYGTMANGNPVQNQEYLLTVTRNNTQFTLFACFPDTGYCWVGNLGLAATTGTPNWTGIYASGVHWDDIDSKPQFFPTQKLHNALPTVINGNYFNSLLTNTGDTTTFFGMGSAVNGYPTDDAPYQITVSRGPGLFLTAVSVADGSTWISNLALTSTTEVPTWTLISAGESVWFLRNDPNPVINTTYLGLKLRNSGDSFVFAGSGTTAQGYPVTNETFIITASRIDDYFHLSANSTDSGIEYYAKLGTIGTLPYWHIQAVDYIEITSGTNLNTLTSPGQYRCFNDSTVGGLINCPTHERFTMIVESCNDVDIKQEIHPVSVDSVWKRSKVTTMWSEWVTGNDDVSWTDITNKPDYYPPIIGTTQTTAMAGNTKFTAMQNARATPLTGENLALTVPTVGNTSVLYGFGTGYPITTTHNYQVIIDRSATDFISLIAIDVDSGAMWTGNVTPSGTTTPTWTASGTGSVSWDNITGKPSTFPPTIGTTAITALAGNTSYRSGTWVPAWTDVTGKPVTYPADWVDITSKPSTFPPTIGTTATTAKAGNYVPAWADITSKPTTFAPIIGTTATTAMAGNTALLQIGTTATTAKAGNYAPAWGDVTGKPATFAPTIGTTATTAMAGNKTFQAPLTTTVGGTITLTSGTPVDSSLTRIAVSGGVFSVNAVFSGTTVSPGGAVGIISGLPTTNPTTMRQLVLFTDVSAGGTPVNAFGFLQAGAIQLSTVSPQLTASKTYAMTVNGNQF